MVLLLLSRVEATMPTQRQRLSTTSSSCQRRMVRWLAWCCPSKVRGEGERKVVFCDFCQQRF
jgi:hypothetical protein